MTRLLLVYPCPNWPSSCYSMLAPKSPRGPSTWTPGSTLSWHITATSQNFTQRLHALTQTARKGIVHVTSLLISHNHTKELRAGGAGSQNLTVTEELQWNLAHRTLYVKLLWQLGDNIYTGLEPTKYIYWRTCEVHLYRMDDNGEVVWQHLVTTMGNTSKTYPCC